MCADVKDPYIRRGQKLWLDFKLFVTHISNGNSYSALSPKWDQNYAYIRSPSLFLHWSHKFLKPALLIMILNLGRETYILINTVCSTSNILESTIDITAEGFRSKHKILRVSINNGSGRNAKTKYRSLSY